MYEYVDQMYGIDDVCVFVLFQCQCIFVWMDDCMVDIMLVCFSYVFVVLKGFIYLLIFDVWCELELLWIIDVDGFGGVFFVMLFDQEYGFIWFLGFVSDGFVYLADISGLLDDSVVLL